MDIIKEFIWYQKNSQILNKQSQYHACSLLTIISIRLSQMGLTITENMSKLFQGIYYKILVLPDTKINTLDYDWGGEGK